MHTSESAHPAFTTLLWNGPELPERLATEQGITSCNGVCDTAVSQPGKRAAIQGNGALTRISGGHLYCIKLFHLGNLFIATFFFKKKEEDESLNQAPLGARYRINGAVWILLDFEECLLSVVSRIRLPQADICPGNSSIGHGLGMGLASSHGQKRSCW